MKMLWRHAGDVSWLKGAVVEAVRWDGDNTSEVEAWVADRHPDLGVVLDIQEIFPGFGTPLKLPFGGADPGSWVVFFLHKRGYTGGDPFEVFEEDRFRAQFRPMGLLRRSAWPVIWLVNAPCRARVARMRQECRSEFFGNVARLRAAKVAKGA